MVVALITSRPRLREWRDSDAEPFLAMSADPAMAEHLPAGDEAWMERSRTHWREHGFGQFVVELPEEAPLIGVVGIVNIPAEYPCAPASTSRGGSRFRIGVRAMRSRRRAPRSTTGSAGCISTRSPPSPLRPTGVRGA
jgi:hypothetical protein